VTQTTALEKLKAQFIATLWPLADAYNQSACSEKLQRGAACISRIEKCECKLGPSQSNALFLPRETRMLYTGRTPPKKVNLLKYFQNWVLFSFCTYF
jgi:hypothetical protein